MATDSGHSPQSQTHPRLLERDSGPPTQTQSADSNRVESKFRNCQSDFPVLGDSRGGHVCISPQRTPTSVHVSSSRATSSGGGCSVTRLAGEIDVLFPPILLLNKIIQKLQVTHAAEVILIAPWWPSQPWFSQ